MADKSAPDPFATWLADGGPQVEADYAAYKAWLSTVPDSSATKSTPDFSKLRAEPIEAMDPNQYVALQQVQRRMRARSALLYATFGKNSSGIPFEAMLKKDEPSLEELKAIHAIARWMFVQSARLDLNFYGRIDGELRRAFAERRQRQEITVEQMVGDVLVLKGAQLYVTGQDIEVIEQASEGLGQLQQGLVPDIGAGRSGVDPHGGADTDMGVASEFDLDPGFLVPGVLACLDPSPTQQGDAGSPELNNPVLESAVLAHGPDLPVGPASTESGLPSSLEAGQ